VLLSTRVMHKRHEEQRQRQHLPPALVCQAEVLTQPASRLPAAPCTWCTSNVVEPGLEGVCGPAYRRLGTPNPKLRTLNFEP